MSNKPTMQCSVCGEGYQESYMDCAELSRMQRDNVCFGCAFWSLKADQGGKTVIDGCYYAPGRRTSGEFRGCAGRRFDIEYFDGKRVTTFDLWVCGAIPAQWRSRLPDTARFLNGAERASEGGIMYFEPSDTVLEPYPLPDAAA
jgi:hypothetical protein